MISFLLRLLACWHGSDDVGVARVGDAQNGHSEIFSTGSSKLDIVASIMMDTRLGQHSIVFNLTFPNKRKY